MSQVVSYTRQNADLTNKWLNKLRATATTGEARDRVGQLSSVLDYYNKETQPQAVNIDWDEWRSVIHTEGVVDKIKAKYEKFVQSEYSVDSAVSKLGQPSDKMKELEVQSLYNEYLHQAHFRKHLEQIETVRNLGDITKISTMEALALMRGSTPHQQAQLEMGNFAPESQNEHGVATRVCTQFSWGSKYNPPFVHSAQVVNSIQATLGKLGK